VSGAFGANELLVNVKVSENDGFAVLVALMLFGEFPPLVDALL